MSGVSDWPFRKRAADAGAALVVSEMIATERLIAAEAAARLKLEGHGLSIHAVQLAGCSEMALARAARIAEDAGADLIDINMGCPAKRVTGAEAGSALMGDIDRAQRLIRATVAAVSVPVTVKMRLGLDEHRLNAADLARRAEGEGAAMLSVHGRTRAQKYRGRADWYAIRAVKASVSIPVIANGDCRSTDDARAMLAASDADGVMVGRAALGAPWLPGAIGDSLAGRPVAKTPVETGAIGEYALDHVAHLVEHAGSRLGLKLARKHIAAYSEHVNAPAALRRAALTAETASEAYTAIRTLFAAAQISGTLKAAA